jgi:hypothetical protein
MIQDQVFICGQGILPHPVTQLFHLHDDVAKGIPNAQVLADKRLAIADCRLAMAREAADWVAEILAADKPVLLLCPGAEHLAGLQGTVGILPQVPVAALLVAARENSSGLLNFTVHALHYTVELSDGASSDAPAAAREKAPANEIAGAGTDSANLGNVFVDPSAVDAFKIQAEKAMDPVYAPLFAATPGDNTPPTGLKYFLKVFNSICSFTYSRNGTSNKGAGTAAFTWTVWGFLDQTAASNSQYLVVEGRISVNAGTLYSNTQSDRGFGNAYVQGTLMAPMQPYSFVPSGGEGTFLGTVSIPISYERPTGGYSIWTYTSSVNNTVDSWTVKSISSGFSLGAQWWMTSPCDGSNLPDNWEHAFDDSGHVKDLTGASSGSLDVNTISAWHTNTLEPGYVNVYGNFRWVGARFWFGFPKVVNYSWNGINFNPSPAFIVNFKPINPS